MYEELNEQERQKTLNRLQRETNWEFEQDRIEEKEERAERKRRGKSSLSDRFLDLLDL